MNTHIEEAIHNFRTAGARYARTERYYRGDHDLAFATEKFANTFGSLFREFALNLCPVVCDAIRDKLRITGFAARSRTDDQIDDPAVRASDVWHRNRMPVRSGEVHREALINGDAFVIVWPDESGEPAIYPNRAANCYAVYDDDHPGRIVRAAKYWRTLDRNTHLNLYYPDRIERYITVKPGDAFLPEAKEFTTAGDPVSNPFGIVPMFHFANNAEIGSFGRSELDAAIPIQDGLNKSVLDMLVAMEFSAYRQRWAAGIEIAYDNDGNAVAPFKAGVDHLWITENPNARFGDFDTAALDQFIKVKDSFRIDLASVTGTPMYYLLPHTRGFPSGESLTRAEARFIAKIRDRQAVFGHVWSEVMEFALRIGGFVDVRLETEWSEAS